MQIALYMVEIVALLGVVAVVTGYWRKAFTLFALRPSRMTVARLNLCVSDSADAGRVNSILASFAGGFNAMITGASERGWRGYCESLPSLLTSFAHEGAAMGYTVRHLFRYRAGEFERSLVKPRPEMRYLYYVGLGFWSGIRNHTAKKMERIVDGLDPLHRYLCYDGYGFKRAFFDFPGDAGALRLLDNLQGYARHAAYQGVGRAFWFLYMDRPDLLVERMRGLGPHAVDAAAGMGLASVFVFPDRLEVAQRLGGLLPPEWRDSFHLGMCFALKARSINDQDQFERWMQAAPAAVREAAYASIRECDRVELLVRSEPGRDGYRQWRARVTEWMAGHIEFPMASVRTTPGVEASTRAPVPA